ncbi:MAG: helix-turn-helix transcriptional regulator [Akkermansiaceae bacterium]|nr:helix-turn-helix transcriptional regulator [Akkermansiaceae bacterium]
MNTLARDFPARFRAARNRTGLSRSKLAEILRVNRETVGRWETGTRYPDISKLKRIHDILGADALPHTNADLPGLMKRFRMKMGYRMKKAASLVKKHGFWWSQLENRKRHPNSGDKQILLEILSCNG